MRIEICRKDFCSGNVFEVHSFSLNVLKLTCLNEGLEFSAGKCVHYVPCQNDRPTIEVKDFEL